MQVTTLIALSHASLHSLVLYSSVFSHTFVPSSFHYSRLLPIRKHKKVQSCTFSHFYAINVLHYFSTSLMVRPVILSTLWNPVVTLWPPALTLKIILSAYKLQVCVLCGSQNKQRLFSYTALTNRFLQPRRGVFPARYVLPTLCIYVFCVDLRTNSDYSRIQH